MANREYTRINLEGTADVYQCNDCGACAEDPREVVHHATCIPGESQKWIDFYSQPENNEEDDDIPY